MINYIKNQGEYRECNFSHFSINLSMEQVNSTSIDVTQIASCNNNKNPIKRQKEII